MAIVGIQNDSLPKSPIPFSANTICSNVAETSSVKAYGTTGNIGSRHILVVDDDIRLLELVSKMVSCIGDQPTMAFNGADALDHLSCANYDLVITDYEMPIIDGGQLADQIKKLYIGTRIIMMTGHLEGDVEDLLGARVVDGLLLKPFSLKTLQEKIKMVCQLHDQQPLQPR